MPASSMGDSARKSVGLPPIVFFFTVDQIAALLSVEEETVHNTYLYYAGRTTGMKRSHQMNAINIAPDDERPDWRVPHNEFVAWLKRRGYHINVLTTFR